MKRSTSLKALRCPKKKTQLLLKCTYYFTIPVKRLQLNRLEVKKNQSQEVRFNSEVSKAYFNTQILTLKVINDIYLINTDFCNLENIMSYICYVENYLIIFSDING